jgi:hypothetical protein
VYGWQIGIWGALYFNFCIREDIIRHIDIDLKSSNINMNRHAFFATALFALAIISQVIAYYAVELNFEIPQLWKDNLATLCNP